MFKNNSIPKEHVYKNTYSAKENNTGYTLNLFVMKDNKKILETGVQSFLIKEGLSKLFQIEIELKLPHNEFIILCTDLTKQGHTVNLEEFSHLFYFLKVHVQLKDSKGMLIRQFNGHISSANASILNIEKENSVEIKMFAQPLPWFMQHSNNYLAYIKKPTNEIIEETFKTFCTDCKVGETFKPNFIVRKERDTTRMNCVQNGESYWDFVLRLLDEEDWNYTFVHKDEKIEMYIYDNSNTPTNLIENCHKPNLSFEIIDSLSSVSQGTNDQLTMKKEYLASLFFSNHGLADPTEVFDSDYRVHGTELKGETTNPKNFGSNVKSVQLKWKTGNEGAKKYVNPSDVNNYSEIKAKKLEAKFAKDTQTAFGVTNSVKAYLGSIISADYPFGMNSLQTLMTKKLENYRVQELTFTFQTITTTNGCYTHFQTALTMHPKAAEFGVEQPYMRNYIDGTTHAKVIADDKKIYLDKDFFIKISLPWQYNAKNNFIYARYMSPWASQKYGMFVTPRHDDEVIVTFEDGDPDLPLVIGSVYNPKKNYPVDFKTKKHVLTIYDQPSENKKNNFFEMDHKKATVNLAAAQHMKIRSFGDHLTQSKWKMEMITAKNMLSKSKEQMEFKADKNMLHEAKEHMEVLTDKYYHLQAKEYVEVFADKNVYQKSKEQTEVISEKFIALTSKEHTEVTADKQIILTAKEDMTLATDKKFILNAKEEIEIISNKKITFKVGSSVITMEPSGDISIKGTNIKISGASKSINLN